MRDKLVHFYSGVNLEIVWKVAKEEVPELRIKVKKIIEESKNE